ncbi:hypothetical protein ACHAXA_000093 [Cyclostephanos tholiformis]|uniref:Pre-mRNA-splicing factor 18 n=1 Tax=Cyclostephanos tholiformis TaxID=382380 RepID=A0ABD3R596_9STRA
MDLLRAELERKRKAIAVTSAAPDGEKRRYLTAAERRRRLVEEEEMEMTDEREKKRTRRRRKKTLRRRGVGAEDDDHDDEDDDDDEGFEEEDLTTMITRRYAPSSSSSRGAGGHRTPGEGTTDADGGHASSPPSSSTAAVGGMAVASTGGGGGVGGGDDDYDADADAVAVVPGAIANLAPGEVVDELRKFGLPVRLFGEDDRARLVRLSIAVRGREATDLGESMRDEFLLDSANRTRNVFLERDGGGLDGRGGDDDDDDEDDQRRKKKSSSKGGEGEVRGRVIDNAAAIASAAGMSEEERNDRPKRIYRYFKSLIKIWEEDLSRRPDSIKRSASGKNETKTLKQCKDYIRPLFQLCKRRELEDGLQNHLFNIVLHCEAGEFVRAHDAYMDVAIGRAAWPIGVTMVGIHARSGRAKIESSNVAHMMNSEVNRKYLTSVKRLMSYAQKKRPDVHPSKKVMNV